MKRKKKTWKAWKEPEVQFLIEMYPTHDTEKIAKALGISRQRVLSKATLIGIKKEKIPSMPVKFYQKRKRYIMTNFNGEVVFTLEKKPYWEDVKQKGLKRIGKYSQRIPNYGDGASQLKAQAIRDISKECGRGKLWSQNYIPKEYKVLELLKLS